MKTYITAITLSVLLLSLPVVFAGEVTGLTSFSAGTPARAAEVNANFTATKTAVDDNHARIAAQDQLRSAGALFGQLAFTNVFPSVAFNALRCTDNSSAMTVTLSAGNFPVTVFLGSDAISQPYTYYVAFQSSTALNTSAWPGTAASVVINSNGMNGTFSGVVNAAGLLAVANGLFTYGVELKPVLSNLALNKGYSIWQSLSVPNIVSTILGSSGITVTQQLISSYPNRDVIVQYDESQLDFISRLTEEAGIFYYFNSGGALVLSDNVAATPVVAQAPVYAGHLVATNTGQAVLNTLHAANRRLGGSFGVGSYDFTRSTVDLFGTATAGGVGNEFEFAPSLTSQTDLNTRAAINRDRSIAAVSQINGTTNVPGFRSGLRVDVSDISGGGFSGSHLLTQVKHLALFDTARRCVTYANSFTATSALNKYIPPRVTPVPKATGVVTATVAGPPGVTRFVDSFGRVKVHFHWDRLGPTNQNASGWVRVLLPAGRISDTALFIPDVGTEVMVGFINGDPSLPVVLGSVYNSRNPPPVTLP